MTPREFDAIVKGLHEYREEEARQTEKAMQAASGKQVMGGGTIRNP